MNQHPYQKLIAWKEAYDFVIDVYDATKQFPGDERFGITSQLRRAATSIALNIAEGQGKQSSRDFLRFCDIAKGSLRESSVLLELSRDLGYLTAIRYDQLDKRLRQTGYLLTKLMDHLRTLPTKPVIPVQPVKPV